MHDLFSLNVEVLNEREIVINDKSILKPDRVVFHNPGQISIIDYKTGEQINKHITQLKEYASFFEKLGYQISQKTIVYVDQKVSLEHIY